MDSSAADEFLAGAGSSAPAGAKPSSAGPRRSHHKKPEPIRIPADQLAGTLARLLGLLTLLLALVATKDPDAREAIVLEAEEAEAIARPAARMLERTALVSRYGAAWANGSDFIELAFALLAYGMRIEPIIAASRPARPILRFRTGGQRVTPEQDPGLRQAADNGAGLSADGLGDIPGWGYAPIN